MQLPKKPLNTIILTHGIPEYNLIKKIELNL